MVPLIWVPDQLVVTRPRLSIEPVALATFIAQLKIPSPLPDAATQRTVSAAIPRSIQIRSAMAPASSAGTGAPRPIGPVRPVDGASISTQRSLNEIPLVGAHDVLRHPHKMAGRGAAGLVGEGQKHSVPADGALFGGVALGAPRSHEPGTRRRALLRRPSHGAGRLQLEADYSRGDR